jgi:hypothetical protein
MFVRPGAGYDVETQGVPQQNPLCRKISVY